MDREILFRGKSISTGEWIEGNFIHRKQGLEYIRNNDSLLKVDPATVGQFTGLCDKDGKKIFEGDIIVNDAGIKGIVEYFNELTWDGGCPHPGFYCKEWIEGIATDTDMFYHYNFSKVLVIGNIHDRSKLAKGESE